jgi:hypothetical protein
MRCMNGSALPGMNCVPDSGFFARRQTWETLSPQDHALFGHDGVFSTLGWYRSTIETALPAHARAEFIAVGFGHDVLALFPMQREPGSASALTTPYTCLWQPLLAASVRDNAAMQVQIGKAFAAACRVSPTTRLDSLNADASWLPPLLEGIRRGGLYPLRFDHFGNWHEVVPGLGWEDYIARRPGALREAIRRRGKKLMEKMGATISMIDSHQGLEPAIAAYEHIYAASWKEPEPFPLFTAAFMREAAEDGSLRLGLLSLNGKKMAAQVWVVRDGCAAVLKLAHDEESRLLSPGTVLTAAMIRHMLEQEHVTELDFGRGDDEYKRDWTRARRQRIGFLLANPQSLRGSAAILRHVGGEAKKLFFEKKNQKTFMT